MSTAVVQELTLADVLQQLGGISPRRIRFRPAPGTEHSSGQRDQRGQDERAACFLDRLLSYSERLALRIAGRGLCGQGREHRSAAPAQRFLGEHVQQLRLHVEVEVVRCRLDLVRVVGGKVGAVGFCMSGGLTIALAKAMPDRIAAAA